jgi:hypothetical protein
MSAYSPPTRTVGEVIKDVTRKFGDEAGIELENTDIVRWINDAMDTIVARNNVLKARAKINTEGGKNDYPLSQLNIQEIETVHYNGLRLPVMPFAEAEEKLFSTDDYADEAGDPVLWYAWDGVLFLWPVPQGDGLLEVFYSAKPQKVVLNENLILPFPDKYYQAIVLYVLQQAREMGEDWQAAQQTQAQFDTTLSNFGEDDRTEQNMTYPVVGIVDDF